MCCICILLANASYVVPYYSNPDILLIVGKKREWKLISMKVDKKTWKKCTVASRQVHTKALWKSVLYFVNSVVKMSENEVILVTRWHCKLYVECIVIIIMTSFQSCAVVTPTLFFFFRFFFAAGLWIAFSVDFIPVILGTIPVCLPGRSKMWLYTALSVS